MPGTRFRTSCAAETGLRPWAGFWGLLALAALSAQVLAWEISTRQGARDAVSEAPGRIGIINSSTPGARPPGPPPGPIKIPAIEQAGLPRGLPGVALDLGDGEYLSDEGVYKDLGEGVYLAPDGLLIRTDKDAILKLPAGQPAD